MSPRVPIIVLVDDDTTTNFLNELLLRQLNAADRLLVARNGQEALAVLHQHCALAPTNHPVLVLLDIHMPVMNGFEFMEACVQLPWARERVTIIVTLTTPLHPRDRARAATLGVADFIAKPLTPATVAALLRKHFSPPDPVASV